MRKDGGGAGGPLTCLRRSAVAVILSLLSSFSSPLPLLLSFLDKDVLDPGRREKNEEEEEDEVEEHAEGSDVRENDWRTTEHKEQGHGAA